jgi:hypothetical protein
MENQLDEIGFLCTAVSKRPLMDVFYWNVACHLHKLGKGRKEVQLLRVAKPRHFFYNFC